MPRFCKRYFNTSSFTANCILQIEENKFKSSGSVKDRPTLVRRRNPRSTDNITPIDESMQNN